MWRSGDTGCDRRAGITGTAGGAGRCLYIRWNADAAGTVVSTSGGDMEQGGWHTGCGGFAGVHPDRAAGMEDL